MTLQSDVSISSENNQSELNSDSESADTETSDAGADSLIGEDEEEQKDNQETEKRVSTHKSENTKDNTSENEVSEDEAEQDASDSVVDENLSSDEVEEEIVEKTIEPTENKYVEVENNEGLVEVYSSIDLMASYKERREATGWYLSAGVENFTPLFYKSAIDDEFYDVLFFDDAIQMTTFTAFYKWNTRVGSIGIGYEYAQGSIYNTDDDINLDIVRTGLGFIVAFDMMRDEPKYVPYFKLHADQHDFIEDRPTEDRYYGEITGIGFGYGLGLMIQMDQFDKESSRDSYAEWGIQNTFLDLALNWQQKSSNADDQNFETETSDPGLSAALRLEF